VTCQIDLSANGDHLQRGSICVDHLPARAYRREMSNSQTELARILKRLQLTANQCASSFSNSEVKVEYRVAFCAEAPLPWRLVEIHRAIKKAGTPRVLRRMHCFRSCDSLEHSVRERITWKAKDQALVRAYLVRVNTAPQNSSGDTSGGGSDTPRILRDPNSYLPALNATRQALRARMCSTRPDRAVDLPN
jgi:hypothetical protein